MEPASLNFLTTVPERTFVVRICMIVSIFFLGLALRGLGMNHGLPHLYEAGDEGALLKYAMAFGTGDFNPHMFVYPSLFLYLLFGLFGALFVVGKVCGIFANAVDFASYYFHHISTFYVLGRILTISFGALSVVVLYGVGRNLFSPAVGLVASGFLAVASHHVYFSKIIHPDVPAVFFMIVSIYFAGSVLRVGAARDYVLAGLFAGFAASTKYPAGVALVSFIVAHFLSLDMTDKRVLPRAVNGKLWLGLLVFVIGFVTGTPFAVLDFHNFVNALVTQAEWTTGYGDQLGLGLRFSWWIDNLRFIGGGPFGWPLLVVTLLGCVYGMYTRTRSDVVILLPALIMYVFFSLPAWSYAPPHYLLPVVPLGLVMGARLVVHLAQRVEKPKRAIAIVTVVVVAPLFVQNARAGYTMSLKEPHVIARGWIERNIAPGTGLLVDRGGVELTYTRDAWERVLGIVRSRPAKSHRHVPPVRQSLNVDRQKREELFNLRDRSISEVGVPYDLYLIFDDREFFTSPPPPELNFYETGVRFAIERYGVKYAVISFFPRRYRAVAQQAGLENEALRKRIGFYDSIECCYPAVFATPQSEIVVYDLTRRK